MVKWSDFNEATNPWLSSYVACKPEALDSWSVQSYVRGHKCIEQADEATQSCLFKYQEEGGGRNTLQTPFNNMFTSVCFVPWDARKQQEVAFLEKVKRRHRIRKHIPRRFFSHLLHAAVWKDQMPLCVSADGGIVSPGLMKGGCLEAYPRLPWSLIRSRGVHWLLFGVNGRDGPKGWVAGVLTERLSLEGWGPPCRINRDGMEEEEVNF